MYSHNGNANIALYCHPTTCLTSFLAYAYASKANFH
jgi:hypothetical protein